MSKPRSPGQTLIAVALDEQLLSAIDKRRGGTNRSAFVRESLASYLGISMNLAAAPDRTNKGGRPRKILPLSKMADQETVSTIPTKKEPTKKEPTE